MKLWIAIVETFLETFGGYQLDDVLEEDFGAIIELIRMKTKMQELQEEEAETSYENNPSSHNKIPPGARR